MSAFFRKLSAVAALGTGSGIAITSKVNNTIIRDNLVLGRTDIKSSDFGILLFMYNDDSTDRFRYSPSDTLIYNNTIRYFSNGVGCDYYGYGNWGFHNVISSNTIVDNDLGIYVWTLYDNNTIENNYIRNIQMTNSSSLGWAGIYIKSELNLYLSMFLGALFYYLGSKITIKKQDKP